MPGVFKIQINNEIINKILNTANLTAKQISNELKDEENLKKYLIHVNSYNLPIIGKFIEKPLNIEENGSYSMKYIKGINLMDILKKNNPLCKTAGWNSKEIKLNRETGIEILKELLLLENELYRYSKSYSLRGDWFLHNLIYDISRNQIYNIISL